MESGAISPLNTELREACIQFEMYRSLMNVIASGNKFEPIQYDRVQPELNAEGKSVDLVLDSLQEGSPKHFLVIEVKRRTSRGLPVFNDGAKDQAKEYATRLKAPYYVVTDGRILRLFKTPDKPIGDYGFSLGEDDIRRLLGGLAEIHMGRTEKLPFQSVPSPEKEIEEMGEELAKTLHTLFEELSGTRSIEVKHEKREFNMEYLSVGPCKRVLRLGLKPKESYIHIQLDALRKALGPERFVEQFGKLSDIQGFKWLKEDGDQEKPFRYRPLEGIITDEPDSTALANGLRSWLLELADILRETKMNSAGL